MRKGFEWIRASSPSATTATAFPMPSRGLHRLATPAGPIWEFPPSVARFAGLNVPVGGGGYFRLFPCAVDGLLPPPHQPRRAAARHVLRPSLGTRSRPTPHSRPVAAVAVPPLRQPRRRTSENWMPCCGDSASGGCATKSAGRRFATILVRADRQKRARAGQSADGDTLTAVLVNELWRPDQSDGRLPSRPPAGYYGRQFHL